jgi:hypothetical protein
MFIIRKHNPIGRSIIDHYDFKYRGYRIGMDIIDDIIKINEFKYSIYCKFKIMYKKHWHVNIDAVCKIGAKSASGALKFMKIYYRELFIIDKFQIVDFHLCSMYSLLNKIMIVWYWIYSMNPIQTLLNDDFRIFKENCIKYMSIFTYSDMKYMWIMQIKLLKVSNLIVQDQRIESSIIAEHFGANWEDILQD